MTNEEHEKLHEDACEKLRLLKDAREAWIYDGDNEKYRRAFDDNASAREKLWSAKRAEITAAIDEENTAWGLPYDHANPNAEINAEIDAVIEAELLRDLLDVAAVQRCEGLTAPETYEVLQDEPSDELMARLKAIVKRELKQD